MIDLLVIHPGAQHGIYGQLGDSLTALEPPTWARIVAAYVRDRGYSVGIIDQEAERLSAAALAYRAQDLAPRLIAIVASGHQPSASTQQMVAAGEVARALTLLMPDVPRLMLGNHPSALPERTLRDENVTHVADGEGVETILSLFRATEHQTDVPGLVYWSGGEVRSLPPPPLVDPNSLHGDAWDLLPMDRYRAHNWQCLDGWPRQPYASIYTTFGCPHRCHFCCINSFQHSNAYRTRDPIRVVDQIERLYRDHGVRTLKIADEMFVLNLNHYLSIAEELYRRGLGEELSIWAYARVDTVRPDNLYRLRRAGIRWLALGIESASALVRDGANKRLRQDDIVGVVRAVQDAGIAVVGNFIFGLEDDTDETMRATLALALECRPEWANFYSAMPYPGSILYARTASERPGDLPPDWSAYSQHNRRTFPLPTATASRERVLWHRDHAHRVFFSDPLYRSRLTRRFGPAAEVEVDRMLEYDLPRDLFGGRSVRDVRLEDLP